MGLTKSQIFTDNQNNLATLCKVLGHPARIAILQYISNQKSCICNNLFEEIEQLVQRNLPNDSFIH